MTYTIQQIADALGAKAVGDTTLRIAKLAEPATAHADDLALAMSPKYAQTLSDGAALAAMLWPDADWQGMGLKAAILPDRPRFAMSGLTRMMDPGQGFETGIHPSAIIDPAAQLADDVSGGGANRRGQHHRSPVLYRDWCQYRQKCLSARPCEYRRTRQYRRQLHCPARCPTGRRRIFVCDTRTKHRRRDPQDAG